MKLVCGAHLLDCSEPKIMAVLNVTPDSFFDGGTLYREGKLSRDATLRKVEQLIEEGADIIDVGGESTRPGATPVSAQEEMDRVLPVVEYIAAHFNTLISVDTSCAELITAAGKVGAGLINDVRALSQPGALLAAADTGLPICLMHMQGSPQTMQRDPRYTDAFDQVRNFLRNRRDDCARAGISPQRILLDPGIGFGKSDAHNLELLRRLDELVAMGPVLLGVSRKSMFGRLLGRPVEQRLPASLATALMACQKGVSILRVHDVASTRDVITMWQLMR